jgi:APA family basic amino acid/polyamine antiporter
LWSATALVVSNMIGTGIFTGTGFLAAQLGSTELILAIFIVGGIAALLGAVCYAELGINLPRSGGEYVYLTEAFGPVWGFMTGWASFFAGFSAPIAAAALAFAGYLAHFYPSLYPPAIACVLVAVFTALNITGVKRTSQVQNILTGL